MVSVEEPSSGLSALLIKSATQKRHGFPCIIECVREHDPATADELKAAILTMNVSRSHKIAFLADMGLRINDSVITHHMAGHCMSCRDSQTS